VGLLEEHVAGLRRDLALIHGDMAAMRDASIWPIARRGLRFEPAQPVLWAAPVMSNGQDLNSA
jgi:hypothetical protein